ncbi:MAG TPA: ABC transporter permease [Firmicutes bacterium]|nr:ABC transporter permease [Bacillota bacterium]
MFGHVFSYRLKCLLRNREQVFWTLLFPLLLATFFYFAFGHLTSEREKFETVKVAVIDNQAYREEVHLQQMLAALSTEGEGQMLELTVTDEAEAEKLLEEGAVAGIVTAGESVGLTVKQSGLKQSILKAVLDEYAYIVRTTAGIISENPAAARRLVKELEKRPTYTEAVSFSGVPPDTMLAYFYALIAMACLYSSFWSLQNTIDLQADLSARGARRSAAPTHKLKVVLSDTLAALTISFAEVLVLLVYLAVGLQVSFGNQVGYILLTCLAGCLVGVSFGNLIGTVIRGSEGIKRGILIGGSLTLCYLAGLMWVDMKYIIATRVPLLAYINPAALITDAFYSLYIFDSHHRFYLNIGLLCLLSALMSLLSFLRLRGERYGSI